MEFYKNWLVGLDMTETDIYLIKNILRLSRKLKPASLTFLHIASPPDLPREVLNEIPDLHAPQHKYFENRIATMLSDAGFKDNYQIIIEEGHALTTLLRYSKEDKFDLLVVGKKGKEGQVERRIARKAACPVLFIPEKIMDLNEILVPVDFSEHSQIALDVAESLIGKVDHVNCLHIYRDSSKYISQVVETLDDVHEMLAKRTVLDQKLEAYARHKLEEFLVPYRNLQPFSHIHGINKSIDIGQAIVMWAETHPSDMVILGSRGISSAAAALLGSVSDKVFSELSDFYLLVIRKPGENVSLIQALLGK